MRRGAKDDIKNKTKFRDSFDIVILSRTGEQFTNFLSYPPAVLSNEAVVAGLLSGYGIVTTAEELRHLCHSRLRAHESRFRAALDTCDGWKAVLEDMSTRTEGCSAGSNCAKPGHIGGSSLKLGLLANAFDSMSISAGDPYVRMKFGPFATHYVMREALTMPLLS